MLSPRKTLGVTAAALFILGSLTTLVAGNASGSVASLAAAVTVPVLVIATIAAVGSFSFDVAVINPFGADPSRRTMLDDLRLNDHTGHVLTL